MRHTIKYMKILLLILLPFSTLLADLPQSGSNHIDYRKERIQIWLDIFAEHKELSKDSIEINEQAQKLMIAYAERMCIKGDFKDRKSLANQARKLLMLTPKDPMTMMIIGRILYLNGENNLSDLHLMNNCLRYADKLIQKSSYSSHTKLLSSRYLRDTIKKSAKMSKKLEDQYETNYMHAFVKYMLEPAQGTLLRYKGLLANDYFSFRKTSKYTTPCYEAIIKQKHKLDSWLREIISGHYHRNQGYLTHKNGKYEDKFNDDHHHFHVTAALHFKEAHNLRPQWPEAAAIMIRLCHNIDGEKSPKEWFLESIKAEFDHAKAYENYISQIEDDNDKLLEFGRMCSATNRYDTIVPYMHVNTVDSVFKNLRYDIEKFNKTKAYDEIHEVFKAYEQKEVKEKYFLTTTKNHIRALHFCYAFKTGRYSHVRKLHQLFGDSIYSKVFCQKFDIDYKPALSLSYAMSGTASKLVKVLHNNFSWETLLKENRWRTENELDQLLKTLKDAKEISQEKESEFFFDKMTILANWEKQYLQGKWVNLDFNKDLNAWRIFKGNWKVLDKKTIQANTLDDQRQYISSEGIFEPPYILEVEVESIKSNWRGNLLHAGLIVGRMYGPKSGRSFWVDGFRKRAGFVIPGQVPEGCDMGLPGKKNKITVYCWDGRFEIYVNDGAEEFILNDKSFQTGRVGLGIMPWLLISGKVNYSNFRIKKLNFEKPPKAADNQTKLEYYKSRYEKDPTSNVCYELAECYAEKEEYEKALEVLKQGMEKWSNWRFPYYIGRYSFYSGKYDQVSKMFDLALQKGTYDVWIKSKVLNYYSWFLSTCKDPSFRDAKRAIKMSHQVLKIRANQTTRSYQLGVMSAAYAADGQFEKAVETINKALKKATSESFKKSLQERLELYKAEKPYISDH